MTLQRFNFLMTWLLIGIFLIGGCLWSWYAPSCIDDYTYSRVPQEFTYESFERCDGRTIQTFSDAFDAIRHDMVADNGRLANFVHSLFAPCPGALERIANCIAMAVFTILMCMLTGRHGKPTPAASALTLIGIWLALPWYDGLQALVFQTNYVWGGALMCAGLLLCQHIARLNRLTFTLSVLLMWVLGWWHEGFALTIIVFFTTDLCLNRTVAPKRRMLMILAVVAGFICNLAAGTLRRITTHEALNGNAGHFAELLTGILLDLAPVLLAILLSAVVIMRTKTNRLATIRELAPWLAATVMMTILAFALQMYGRTFWPALILAIIINVRLLRRLFPISAVAIAPAMIVVAIMSGWWFVRLIHYERKVRSAYDGFVTQLQQYAADGRNSNVVYGALGGKDAVPWYLMGIPDSFEENFEGSRYLANNFGHYNNVIVMLPDSLRHRNFESLPRYEGNTQLRGVWPVILAPDSASLGVLNLCVDAPGSAMSPLDYLLANLRGDTGRSDYPLMAWRFPATMPDGRKVFVYYVVRRPRIKRYRQPLAISADYQTNMDL